MHSNQLTITLAVALAALSMAACTTMPTGDAVSAGQAQTASRVTMGTVTGSRPVTVEGNRGSPGAVVGTIAGGIAGGLLGNEVGGGTGQVLATGAGATLGAAAGNQVAQAASRYESTEWFVQTEGGQTVSVIQESPTFATGQRVQIVQSGSSTRLVP